MERKEVYKLYKELQALQVKLEKLARVNVENQYLTVHTDMVKKLRVLLLSDFRKLNSKELLNFISWCSTYRPYEPHTILLRIAMCSKLNEKQEPATQS